jgi:hypothetical protein
MDARVKLGHDAEYVAPVRIASGSSTALGNRNTCPDTARRAA